MTVDKVLKLDLRFSSIFRNGGVFKKFNKYDLLIITKDDVINIKLKKPNILKTSGLI